MKALLLNRKSGGLHLSGTVTVGYGKQTQSNTQHYYYYGMTKWTNETIPDDVFLGLLPLSPIGSSSIPSLGALFSQTTDFNTSKLTRLALEAEDQSIFENKTVTVMRLDTRLTFTASYLYDAEGKQAWYWVTQPEELSFFTSADNGKTISINIDMEE